MALPTWYLEGFNHDKGKLLRVSLSNLPFSVGRRSSCDLCLESRMVSQVHAEFFARDNALWLSDQNSTNGTFINGKPLMGEQSLRNGDIVHFADFEFHFNESNVDRVDEWFDDTLQMNKGDFRTANYRELRELLRVGAVQALLQPLVNLNDSTVLGYELLGRGLVDGALIQPPDLFTTAENIGLAAELSRLFRDKGVDEARSLPETLPLFLNSHPAELHDQALLLDSLKDIRERYPRRSLVFEIHESAITDTAGLQVLSAALEQLGIGVAFDDFGKGQTRLLELAEAAPQYLKFDVSLIRNIHRCGKKRRAMVETLVRMVLDMDIVAIAEGIEKAPEARCCAELGFQFGQGYFFAHPTPAAWLVTQKQNRA